jgi:Serine/threonine protein phosphatase
MKKTDPNETRNLQTQRGIKDMIFYGKSDIGMRRSSNQDNYYAEAFSTRVAMCVVCDGMGGAKGGYEASSIAIEHFSAHIKSFLDNNLDSDGYLLEAAYAQSGIHSALVSAVGAANTAVFKKSVEDAALEGMGTTLVAVIVTEDAVYSANVGDSRMYLMSGGEIRQITHDHSYVQYLVDSGKLTPEEALKSTKRNMLARAVGIYDTVTADIVATNLDKENGGYILLCSDGLTNHVYPDEMLAILQEKPVQTEENEPGGVSDEDDVKAKAERLIGRANELGGTDNITVVLVKF